MKLIIMRHGQAGWSAPSDAERPLTEFGKEQAVSTAKQIKACCPVSLILASPYLRAQQTATEVAAQLSVPVVTMEELVPEGKAQTIIQKLPDEAVLMLVSHMPLVGNLTGLLCDGVTGQGPSFDTGSAALLELECPGAGMAQLTKMFLP